MDIRITRLRKKLDDEPGCRGCLRTVRGQGYMFSAGGAP
jgi:DNA-binding response OmpR family regulator